MRREKRYRKIGRIIGLLLLVIVTLLGCSLPGLGKSVAGNGIVIAGGNTTERQILAEIVSQMCDHYLSDTDTDITLINNLGSTLLILQALKGKDANISGAMYTGTSLTGELGLEPATDPDKAMEEVVKGYSSEYNMVWFPSYGFENTYAFMVTRQLADEKGIHKISDLKPYADTLKVGVDTAWIERKGDGYEGFKDLYGFTLDKMSSMEIGLVYDAVRAGKMDVVLGYSTDGRIDAYDLVVLEDDLHLFPPYDASPVATKELLRKYPEVETILLKLEGAIDSEKMQKLNRISDEEQIEPRIVAGQFLEENNYFEEKDTIPLAERELYKDVVRDILPPGKDKEGK
jgi:glycine betaine/choline ABC-type transport system substrate-binding protein